MKRIITILLCFVLLCAILPLTVLATEDAEVIRLVDDAEILSSSEEEKLLEKLDRISEEYKADVIIYTVNSSDYDQLVDYAKVLYDEMDYGQGEDRDGLMLLINMDEEDREYWLYPSGFCKDAFDESNMESVKDAIEPALREEEFADAFAAFIEECEYYLDGYINGFPFRFGGNLVISLLIGFVVALIATSVMRGKLKSVRRQETANQYTKTGSMRVTVSHDLFLYRTVNRVKKAQNNNSSSKSSYRGSGGKF